MRKFEQELSGLVAEHGAKDLSPLRFRKLIEGMQALLLAIGRDAMPQRLKITVAAVASLHIDGQLRCRGTAEQKWLSPVGKLRLRRRTYRGDASHSRSAIPLDERCGMLGRYMTPDVEEMAAVELHEVAQGSAGAKGTSGLGAVEEFPGLADGLAVRGADPEHGLEVVPAPDLALDDPFERNGLDGGAGHRRHGWFWRVRFLLYRKHPVHPPGQLRRLHVRSAWPPFQPTAARPAADFHSRGVSVAASAPSAMRCSTSFRYAQGSIPSRPQLFTSE